MGFLAAVDAWASGLFSPREKAAGDRKLSAILGGGYGAGGPYANAWTGQSRVEQVRHFKHWVYVAVSRIAEKVAQAVPNVSRVLVPRTAEERGRCLLRAHRDRAITPLRSHEELENVDDAHPLVRLLKDPNDPDTAFDLWYETVLFLYLTGSAYWWVPKVRGTGLPAAVWVIPSHWIWPEFDKKGDVARYSIRPLEGNFAYKSLPADDVVHFKRRSPVSKIDGYATTTAVATWIDTQDSIDRTRWFSFQNGAFPGVALEFDPKYLDPSDEDLLRIEAKFAARYAGETRANRPLFLPPGVKMSHFTIAPREMAYVESAEQLRDNILAAFGVPAVVAGISTEMTYGSILAAQAGFTTFAVNPLLAFLGQVITEKLAHAYDDGLRVWWEDMTPQDPELREKQLITDRELGLITPNEGRALRGRQAYARGGDDPVLPGNLTIVPFNSGGDPRPLAPQRPPAGRPPSDD